MKLPELPGYQIESLIGEGNYGIVFRCRHSSGEQRAIKFLKAQAVNPGLIGSCFRNLDHPPTHPNLAETFEFRVSSHPYYYIMPLFGQEDPDTGDWQSDSLERYAGALTVDHSLHLIGQMADALAFLHRRDLIHAGFKPGNVFVTGRADTGYQIKLADFGQGYVIGLQYLEMGDLGFYASPEQLDNGDPSSGAGKRWDVYAFGVVAYRLLTGRLPRLESQHQEFRREQEQSVSHVPAAAFGSGLEQPDRFVDQIVEQSLIEWPGEATSDSEERFRGIIETCLEIDPRDRYPDMRDVAAALEMSKLDLAYARLKTAATDDKTKARKRVQRWRRITALAGILVVAGVLSTGLFYYLWNEGKKTAAAQKSGLQTALESLQESSSETVEQQRARLTEMAKVAEETRSQLLAQNQETIDFMREAQQNGDRFFELILEHRFSDVPGFQEKRLENLAAAQEYYESLLAVYGDAPNFSQSAAKVSRYLGEIESEIGDLERAQYHFTVAESLLDDILANDPNRADVLQALARIKRSHAELFRRRGPDSFPAAIEALQESTGLLERRGVDTAEVRIEIAGNRLAEGELQRLRGERSGAAGALNAAVELLYGLQETHPEDHRVFGGLGRAFANSARMLEEIDRKEDAGKTHQEAANLFAQALKLNAAQEDYQLGLGSSLAAAGALSGEREKLISAAKVLGELAPTDPERVARDPLAADILKSLAACHGELSREQEDGGETGAAIKWETQAIQYLEPIVSGSGLELKQVPPVVRLALAERKIHLAQLQGSADNFPESRKSLEDSLRLINSLLEADDQNAAYRRAHAEAQSQMGLASEQIGDKEGARRHYEVARAEWEAYSSAHPDDDLAAEAVEWTESQLKALN